MRRIGLLIIAVCVVAWGEDLRVTSAANPNGGVAADSLATIYGTDIATVVQSAGFPWPTQLGDISVVYVTDAASNTVMAPILYVSPTQMNIYIPAGLVAGEATIAFPRTGLPPGVGTAALRTVPVTIQKSAPALFSANGSGSGVAAASAIRLVIATQVQGPVQVFRCDATCSAVPIDVGLDAPVYLSLYGTGIRSPSGAQVKIGNTIVDTTYVGPQGQIPGLDQVNVPLPLSLRGSGLVNVTVTVNGVTSNAVQIAIQ
jgi:uncharacterized protein (TIGR03437 family)